MNELQNMVAEFVFEHGLETDVPHRLLDLLSELGELSKEQLKATGYGSEKFSPSANWKGELGDVRFSLICVANSTQVDLRNALQGALKKYQRRIRTKGGAGSQNPKVPQML